MTNYATGFVLRERLYGTDVASRWMQKQINNSPREQLTSQRSGRPSKSDFTDEMDDDIKAMYSMGFMNQEIADHLKLGKDKVAQHIYRLIDIGYMKKLSATMRKARHDKLVQMKYRGKFQDVKLFEQIS